MPKFYKRNKTDRIWWVDNSQERIGVWEFSFDKEKIYNMFRDYPFNMTPEEVEIFNRENPEWKEFFSDRQGGK